MVVVVGGYTSVFNFSMKMGSVSGPHGNLPRGLVHTVFINFSIKMRRGWGRGGVEEVHVPVFAF